MDESLSEKIKKDFVTFDDGFKYYWPEGLGAFSSELLRLIADELDHENKEWENHLNLYFKENSIDTSS